jgi:GcrA cell cycle regulator
MATTNSWSPSTITKLKSLLERGLSTSEIGKKLGFTKNAVVGKINRLGLNNTTKKAPEKKPAKTLKAPAKVQKPAKQVKAPVKAQKPARDKKVESHVRAESKKKTEKSIQNFVALMELRQDQCRWPIGSPDSDDFRFCGEKCFSGKPYCFEHCKVAYQFTPPAKKRQ